MTEEKKEETAQKAQKNDFIVPLRVKDHANMTFAGCDDCSKCCDGSVFTIANVLLNEMFDTAKLFPVVFFQKDDQLSLSLIYTLKRGVPCPYLDAESGWCNVYDSVRPRACKTFPFNVQGNGGANGRINYSVVFDSRCPAVRESENGVPLIEEGKMSQKIINDFIDPSILQDYAKNFNYTREFLNIVSKYKLLEKIDYEIDPGQRYGRYDGFGKQRTLFQFWRISREKLEKLSEEGVMELHKNHFFNAVYTHLNSLDNLKKLEKIKAAYEDKRVDILTFQFG